MSTASITRFGHLLRWVGITLVVLLALQMLVLLASWNWALEPFRQLFVDRLVGESPMALLGLVLMLYGSRLDQPGPERTPIRWVVGLVSIVLAITMVVAVPVSIGSEKATGEQVAQADGALAMQTLQLEREKQQLADPKAVDQVIAQAEKAGQIPATMSEQEKQLKARQFIDTQLKPQLEKQEQQLGQAKLGRDLAVQQRRFGGTWRAAVLAIAFGVLALVALI
ncbi:HpsJ family protein [Cyanobium sp. WAJ14-Wanaka]|uniref:HpsJ family protein n=1 Tax=Cyanobium sp. WAJ14-Wanaka TaxID=2823725 RepID=UPI0020CB777D|nr:HpsJ family protein [Cyanobium sp. WAJ14-Wanaka]MCP9775556.1 HpsJ family protein [Cyanobium sp. WAJ14-Wanaka]